MNLALSYVAAQARLVSAVVKAFRWIGLLLLLVGLGTAFALLPVEKAVDWIACTLAAFQAAGLVAFVLLYVLVTLLIGPAWALSVSAGIVYGFWALAIVLPTAITAATAGFFVARHLFRHRLARHLEARPRLDAIDRAVRDHGFTTVLLLRLSPAIPFGAKSYLLGLTGVSVPSYLAGSALGILPGSLFYVYLGAAGGIVLRNGLDGIELALFAAGLVATAILVVFLHREAEKRLRREGILDKAHHPCH